MALTNNDNEVINAANAVMISGSLLMISEVILHLYSD